MKSNQDSESPCAEVLFQQILPQEHLARSRQGVGLRWRMQQSWLQQSLARLW